MGRPPYNFYVSDAPSRVPTSPSFRLIRMADFDDISGETPRPRYRVPSGMPLRDEGRRTGAVVSVVVHALIIFLLIVPFFMPHSVIERMQQGAGGPGPAGGGGGGTRGSGWTTQEHIQLVEARPNG